MAGVRLYSYLEGFKIKFKGKYRTDSLRLKDWNYSSPGWYFITISTKNKKEYFGHIVNDTVILNSLGNIAFNCWKEIPEHHPNVKIDEFHLLPNHIHGILILEE